MNKFWFSSVVQFNQFMESLKSFIEISSEAPTLIQGAIPQILEKTTEVFFSKIVNVLHKNADICYEKLKDNPYITCPHKPEGSMFVMVGKHLMKLC